MLLLFAMNSFAILNGLNSHLQKPKDEEKGWISAPQTLCSLP